MEQILAKVMRKILARSSPVLTIIAAFGWRWKHLTWVLSEVCYQDKVRVVPLAAYYPKL